MLQEGEPKTKEGDIRNNLEQKNLLKTSKPK